MTHDDEPIGERAHEGGSRERLGRRALLRAGIGGAAAAMAGGGAIAAASATADAAELGPGTTGSRRAQARRIRTRAAELAFRRKPQRQTSNTDETAVPGFAAVHAKGLPHLPGGEVAPAAYEKLLRALDSGRPADFDAIPLGGTRKLVNPVAGLAFDLEGPDSHQPAVPAAPSFGSPETGAEATELYWMALLRDIHFDTYGTDPGAAAAAGELNTFADFRGPRVGGAVVPAVLFRDGFPGCSVGPYVSQFLLVDVPFGNLVISQRQRVGAAATDHLTAFPTWLVVQSGGPSGVAAAYDASPRHVRNGRDLAAFVERDFTYQAFLQAALILLSRGTPTLPGDPYRARTSDAGFVTWGAADVLDAVAMAAERALKAAWFQKWHVHRRLRPEEFGGRLHQHRVGAANYPLPAAALGTQAVNQTFLATGTYLLPQAYPEGCPAHPAYPSAHAAVAGACATMLKAHFDGSAQWTSPVASALDGLSLLPYAGADAGAMTVLGEIHKLASNCATGCCHAGTHWRSDGRAGILLGEQVALGLLEEQRRCRPEGGARTFPRFDGSPATV
jgi:hypothetical protein